MTKFGDEMARIAGRANEQRAANESQQREKYATAQAAQHDAAKTLQEAAAHLRSQAAPKSVKLPSGRSPRGHVISSTFTYHEVGIRRRPSSLLLLTDDGRLWRWKWRGKGHYLVLDASSLCDRSIHLGNDWYLIAGQDGRATAYHNDNDGGIAQLPFATWLAQQFSQDR